MASSRSASQMLSQLSIGGDRSTTSNFAPKSYGSQGQRVKLKSNFFKIDLANPPNVYHYNIEMVPQRFDPKANEEVPPPIVQPAAQSVQVAAPAAPKAPAAQSGKAKGKGRKAALANKAGTSLSHPAVNGLAAKANGLPAKANGLPANGPAAKANTCGCPCERPSDKYERANGAGQPDDASEPPKTARGKRAPKLLQNDIFLAVFNTYPEFACDCLPVFDGEKNFYSTTQFILSNNRWSGMVLVVNGERKERFLVNITIPKDSHYQNYGSLLLKDGRLMPFELQALDILLRNGPRLNKIALGANLYCKFNDPRAKNLQFDIGTGRSKDPLKYIQFGHYQSARRAEGALKNSLYLNVDRAMTIFTKGGDLINYVDLIVPGATKSGPLRPLDIKKIGAEIKGLAFTSKHLPYVRAFFATGLTEQAVKDLNIKIEEDGKEIETTVLKYFQKKYPDFAAKMNKNLPCVKYGPKKWPKYMPIEGVSLLPDEEYHHKLKADQQADVTRASSQQKPFDRFAAIQSQISTIKTDNTIQHPGRGPVDYLKRFGVEISSEPAIVDGRVLAAPSLVYGSGPAVSVKNGQWDMAENQRFFNPSTQAIGVDWAVINIRNPDFNSQKIDDLVNKLIEQASRRGMGRLEWPKHLDKDYRDYNGKGSMKSLIAKLTQLNVKLAIFVFPKNDDIYNEIKALAELAQFGNGLVTQCLSQDKKYWRDARLFPQFISNILLKINPKLGGTNQSIQAQGRPAILTNRKTMFMGLDVTHPTPVGDNLKQSIAAVVATYTDNFDKVFSKVRIQEKGRKELINVTQITKELLESYFKKNNCYPEKIVVYRDGVGEGDFQKMVDLELRGMQRACTELRANTRFTYIMVQKRHNTRFIPANAKSDDRFQNVAPGTIVDRQITHGELSEFYLCSHAGMMGTSRPAKYVVLVDQNKLSADDIQKATYWFCHMYPRCQKTASLPPTIWYAHLLAEKARKYLAHFENSDGMSSAGSGGPLEVLSEQQRMELETKITVHPNLDGLLHFI